MEAVNSLGTEVQNMVNKISNLFTYTAATADSCSCREVGGGSGGGSGGGGSGGSGVSGGTGKSESASAHKQQIVKLKSDIRQACVLATKVISLKDEQIKELREENGHLVQKTTEISNNLSQNVEILKKISIDNQVIEDKLESLRNIIHTAFRELQNLHGEEMSDIPVKLELKKIIIFCKQYYSNYFEERRKFLECSEKNFNLMKKNQLLESIRYNVRDNNVILYYNKLEEENTALKEKLNQLLNNQSNDRLDASNDKKPEPIIVNLHKDIKHIRRELAAINVKLSSFQKPHKRRNSEKRMHETSTESVVNTLLRDQDDMLQELKKLSADLMGTNDASKDNNFRRPSTAHEKSKTVQQDNRFHEKESYDSISLLTPFTMSMSNCEGSICNRYLNSSKTTIILFVKARSMGDSSTLFGITSETIPMIESGSTVASKVKVFEHISSSNYSTKAKIYCSS